MTMLPDATQPRRGKLSRSIAGRGAWLALEWSIFLGAALWLTWPLAAHWTTALPLGCEAEPVVPILNLWTQWWNADRIQHAYRDYWRAPIFYPAPNAFVFSEPQPLAGLAAWALTPLLPSREAVFNVLLWLHLALNGWCTCRMFRSWRCRWWVAIASGLMVEMMPAVHWQLGVVQLVPLWGIVLTLQCLIRLARRPTVPRGLGCGVAAGVTYLLCSYYGLMLGVLAIATVPVWLHRRWLRAAYWRRFVTGTAAAGIVAALIASPVLLAQWPAAGDSTVPPRALVAELASQPIHFLRTPWKQWFPLPGIATADQASPWAFSPGTVKLALAGIGVWAGICVRRHRRLVLFWLALFAVSAVLAMGPTLAPGGYGPHDILVAVCPGYDQLRNIHRFATFGQLALVVLAGLGLEQLWRWMARLAAARFPAYQRTLPRLVGIAIVAIALAEAVPGKPRIFETPRAPPTWVAFLQERSRPDDVVAIFPMPKDNPLTNSRPTALAMVWQMQHERRMINGYSGLVPYEYLEREVRLREFPSVDSLIELQQIGVDLLVVPSEVDSGVEELSALEQFRDSVIREHRDASGAVFRLRQPPLGAPAK
jgi:hypothetical protein